MNDTKEVIKIINITAFVIGCIIGCIAAFVLHDNSPVEGETEPIIIERYVPINNTDSIVHKVNNTKHVIDSLSARCDSLTGELQVATYKLERIRYYNDIAKKGNNLKFLRGWIRRVLDGNE